MRKIIHIDMDAFFASVEQRDFPETRNKPVAVGGSEERGVVSAASYEARKFGVRSAMPGSRGKELCPELIFMLPRFDVYKQVSEQIHTVFRRYTDQIEPLSFDEAYLDVTENKMGITSATFVAQSIKNDIQELTELTASAGVSYNKFLAKMASDMDKPNGLYVIEPKDAKAFIDQLPIEKFHGVGKTTAPKLQELGIWKGKDLRRFSEKDLQHYFGKTGLYLFQIVQGQDDRPVQSNRDRKSIGVENTLAQNVQDETELWEIATKILRNLTKRQEKSDRKGRTLTFKIRYSDFSTFSKSKTVDYDLVELDDFMNEGVQLFNHFIPLDRPVRLIGFSISGFNRDTPEETQLSIF